ncbi:hypothetical protein JOD43_000789 [Pullulanibacillus pueri]|uniref:Fur-regulated basic protein FbpA n=1 Tax=Pullulanibacillus pueri TaxID=1437324 RepID=A0A8J2ZXB8_9BACL|nr:Fur-regulated basic protein FbpA [Pullulanibacillus pueri]MBM7680627.1 hypothetical protein [Pullulanibacillus pueri]GGH83899.1 hypothetical protein GCM10007096_25730 [Pullulanibacillus pueri]
MSHLLREAVEKRREELINKLITFDVYKVQHKHLFELSLSQLEKEYDHLLNASHPHGGMGSIQWTHSHKESAKKSTVTQYD